jgi:cytidine deaminase
MITHGESRIRTIVAVGREGAVLSPCGRCRELICQIDPGNVDTRILLHGGKVTTLRQLLPEHWLLDS